MERKEYWQEEVEMLKAIIAKTELVETTKWGASVYIFNGQNVVSGGGFKSFFVLWFYNGVFLSDNYKVLVNASEGKTKALRQWRFTSKNEINEKRILEYNKEAIENEKQGKRWKPEKSGILVIPDLLKKALKNDSKLKICFEKLTPFKQKEFAAYISEAKREDTRISRLEKIKPMIIQGIGLHDKYR